MSAEILGVIPARGGSKRIQRKNLMPLAGMPLVGHSVRHLKAANCVSRAIVSTDDPEIAAVAREGGAEVVMRPDALADDKATSEAALLHVLDHLRAEEGYEPRLVVFLQATSPVRRSGDIDLAVGQLEREDADSLFSACRNTKLLWRVNDGTASPLNYDFRARRREQDFAPEYRENGSIYVFRPERLRRDHNRLGGRIAIYVMPEWASFQVDEPGEARLVEWVLREQAQLEAQAP
jgi:CMP-N,N'-diacetyllegionaminic acid synthase